MRPYKYVLIGTDFNINEIMSEGSGLWLFDNGTTGDFRWTNKVMGGK